MPRYKIDMKALKQRSINRAALIEVGGEYFLSSFYDKNGATVKVLSKAAKGQSSVAVVVIEPLGDEAESGGFYAAGRTHMVNACNLYKNRSDASHATKFGTKPEQVTANAHRLMSALTGLSTEKIKSICDRKAAPAAAAPALNAAQKAWVTRRAKLATA